MLQMGVTKNYKEGSQCMPPKSSWHLLAAPLLLHPQQMVVTGEHLTREDPQTLNISPAPEIQWWCPMSAVVQLSLGAACCVHTLSGLVQHCTQVLLEEDG